METSQEVEPPVLVSEQNTLVPEDENANADENLASDVEHADDEKSHETTVIAPGDHMPIPAAIVSMMNNGVEFSRMKDCWHLGEDNVSLKKPFSVYFSLDTPCTYYDVADGLLKLGIDYDDISSIQRRLASNSWVIAFRTAEAKQIALSAWFVTIAGMRVLLADCDNRIVLVKIHNTPNEMPDSVIIGRLAAYGTVFSFRRDLAADSIFNGVRTARMRIERAIPSTVRIAREFIRIWYPGQPKACRRCGDIGHFIKDCTSVRCFNCEQSGHRADECEKPVMCSICLSTEHRERHCPYVLYSANVDCKSFQEPEEPTSYAGAAKSTRVPPLIVNLDPEPPPAGRTKEKEKEEEKEKAMAKEKEKEKEREKERNKNRHESSKEKSQRSHERERESREHGSQKRDRERERERDRDRDRERERERELERARDRSRHHHHHRHEHARDEKHHKDRERDRYHHQRAETSSEASTTDSDEDWIPVRGKNYKSKHR